MIAEIQAGYASAKAALQITQGVIALKSETERNQAVIEIQRHVLETQQALGAAEREYSSGLKRIDTLEAEIVNLKDWAAEKQRYQLEDTGQGSLAYHLKADVEPPEPDHWLCPNCYQQGKKSILHPETIYVGRTETLQCHPCGLNIVTRGIRHEDTPKARASR